jgi:hypothetical protein
MPLPRTKLVCFICVAVGLTLYGTWVGILVMHMSEREDKF